MDHDTQVALVRRIFALLDAKTTELAAAPTVNPVSTYTSPAQLERERAVLFRRAPLLVGLGTDAGVPGAWFTHDEGVVPVLVTRTRAGELAAFANVCRHRGAPVASGAGTGPGRFTCPYHGWTYDDAGRLVGRPCPEGFAGLAPEASALHRLPVAERDGLIFVRPSPGEPIDVDAHLGDARHELAPFDLGRYVRFARQTVRRAMNWKLVIDTFLEAYHVPALHDRSLAPGILGEPAVWDAFGRSGRMVAVRRSIAELRGRPEAEWSLLPHAVILYQLFPNTVLIYQVDHVEVIQAYPGLDGPDHATIVFALYTPEPATTDRARRHFQKNFDLLVDTVGTEDFGIGEAIQRGFHAGVQDTVVYGRNEPGLAHYHQMITAAVGPDAG